MARGSIRQRSKVRKDSWTVQVYLGRDPETGNKRFHSEAIRGTKTDAERRLTALLRELDTEAFARPTQLTVREYLDQWYRDYVQTRLRRRTSEGYRGNLDRYILPKIRTKRIYFIQMPEGLMVKRAVRNGERWQMVSDNPYWPAIAWPVGAKVIGEICWMEHVLRGRV